MDSQHGGASDGQAEHSQRDQWRCTETVDDDYDGAGNAEDDEDDEVVREEPLGVLERMDCRKERGERPQSALVGSLEVDKDCMSGPRKNLGHT